MFKPESMLDQMVNVVKHLIANNNIMPLLVPFDPLECKNLITHLNGTNYIILNNLNYNKTFVLLEHH